jgi:hypothetical protein
MHTVRPGGRDNTSAVVVWLSRVVGAATSESQKLRKESIHTQNGVAVSVSIQFIKTQRQR